MQCKHEIRSKETEITKLRETLQKKAFGDKNNKGGQGPACEFSGPVKANAQYKFSKVSGESDFHLMISSENEKRIKEMTRENEELRDCLVMLQRELMEIVTVKNDIFTKRFKAEYGPKSEVPTETEEAISHQIETIKEELFFNCLDLMCNCFLSLWWNFRFWSIFCFESLSEDVIFDSDNLHKLSLKHH